MLITRDDLMFFYVANSAITEDTSLKPCCWRKYLQARIDGKSIEDACRNASIDLKVSNDSTFDIIAEVI